MPGAASGAPELRTLPAKGAPSQLRQSPSKRNGTLAPLACELWPPYRCPNPHRVCALNTGVGVLRGFLPRGLCDTGPQVVRDHRLGASSGQVSHNPKQKLPPRQLFSPAAPSREQKPDPRSSCDFNQPEANTTHPKEKSSHHTGPCEGRCGVCSQPSLPATGAKLPPAFILSLSTNSGLIREPFPAPPSSRLSPSTR